MSAQIFKHNSGNIDRILYLGAYSVVLLLLHNCTFVLTYLKKS